MCSLLYTRPNLQLQLSGSKFYDPANLTIGEVVAKCPFDKNVGLPGGNIIDFTL